MATTDDSVRVILNMQKKINEAHALILDRIVRHIEEANTSRAIQLCEELARELRT